MKELSLKEIQSESLKILIKIDELCEKLNIHYCIMYGTLIGAIRHNGFIPWDDDIDIVMPRKDYIVLQQYFIQNEKQLSPLYFFSKETRKEYPYLIGRICNTNFSMVSEIEKDYEMGTFVDVYPMDGVGNGKTFFPILKSRLLSSIYYMKSRTKYIPSDNIILNFPKRFIFCFVKAIPYSFILKSLEKLVYLYDYDSSEYVGQMDCFTDGKKNMFLKNDLENTCEHKFENISVKIPVNYDSILKRLYGDYMKLPPEDKRISHHFYKIFSKE